NCSTTGPPPGCRRDEGNEHGGAGGVAWRTWPILHAAAPSRHARRPSSALRAPSPTQARGRRGKKMSAVSLSERLWAKAGTHHRPRMSVSLGTRHAEEWVPAFAVMTD